MLKSVNKRFVLFSHRETDKKQQLLTVYPLDSDIKEEQKKQITPVDLGFLKGNWLSATFIENNHRKDAKSLPNSSPISSSKLLLIESLPRRKLKLHLLDLSLGQSLWSKVLRGRQLLQQPSIKRLSSSGSSSVALLTEQGFYGFELTTGSELFKEAIRLKKSSPEALNQAFEKRVSWYSTGVRLMLLHTLNQALYYSQPKPKLKDQSLQFNKLDPQAYLSSIDHQWLVVSPGSGQVFGLPPQLNQIVWEWNLRPFTSLTLSQDWALVSQRQSAQLFKVVASNPSTSDRALQKDQLHPPHSCLYKHIRFCMCEGPLGLPNSR